MGDTELDPLNLFFLERDYVKEGMNIYVLGFPAEHLRDGKHCTRCLEAPKKLYTCAKCQNPVRLYCVSAHILSPEILWKCVGLMIPIEQGLPETGLVEPQELLWKANIRLGRIYIMLAPSILPSGRKCPPPSRTHI
jgi:hypothetical protein